MNFSCYKSHHPSGKVQSSTNYMKNSSQDKKKKMYIYIYNLDQRIKILELMFCLSPELNSMLKTMQRVMIQMEVLPRSGGQIGDT